MDKLFLSETFSREISISLISFLDVLKLKIKSMLARELLKKHIEKYVHLTDEEFTFLSSLFRSKKIKKKHFLLHEGDVCQFEAFVVSGLLRTYVIDTEGKEHILYFATTDWWVSDIDSFIHQQAASLFIDALEDSEIFFIDYKNKEYLYKQLPKVEELFRKMTQRTHVALQRRMIDNLSKTADVRYQEFINRYPHIANRLTNVQIAAYLGISHEFLSRIRKKISKNKS